MKIRAAIITTIATFSLATGTVEGKDKPSGRLIFLGKTSDLSRSVWLSLTGAGSFELQTQGQQTVDQWTKGGRGVRLTLSPFVSQGSGGTHFLMDVGGSKPVQIDSQNQKGGFTFPPSWQVPPSLPPWLKPPDGGGSGTPEGVKPPVGALPGGGLTPKIPGGVKPPKGTLPQPGGLTPGMSGGIHAPIAKLPHGVTPHVPMGVKPPKGTLPPPGGLTPGMPGGIQAPIAKLPPSGVTPGAPMGVKPPKGTLPPPTGLTPGVSGGVQAPIAKLPPSGVTPEAPMGVKPPKGTLPPPTGLTPGVSGGVQAPIAKLPPSGVTPEVPMGVKPPKGRVPPSGITPQVPGAVRPPTAKLPPGGVTPEVPTGVRPPKGKLPPGGMTPQGPESGVQPPTAKLPPGSATPEPPDGGELTTGPGGGFGSGVPLTPGREFGFEPNWNLWVDSHVSTISDQRHGLDLDGRGGNVSVGIDRRVSQSFVLGVMATLDEYHSSSFKGKVLNDSRGYTVGPYFAWQISPAWVIDGSLGYGQSENENSLAFLDSEFTTDRYTGSITATGQYTVGTINVRPKLTVAYTHSRSEAYELKGSLDPKGPLGPFPINLPRDKDTYNSGVAEASVEVNHVFPTSRGGAFVPFTELGVNYEYVRPGDGKILTGDLTTASTSPWSGFARAGARALLGRSMFIEMNMSYMSLGQRDLDIWEGRLFLSYAF